MPTPFLLLRSRTTTLVPTLALALALAIAGCASFAVTNEALLANTSRALGLESSQFTISERTNEGTKTTYTARTRGGKVYGCYIEGSVSVVGRVVSDALCTEMRGATGKPAPTAPPADPNCNALLRAAGRCR